MQGSFRFTGIPPGDYRLLAWDDVGKDDLQNPDFVTRFESQATAVSLVANGMATASIRAIPQVAVR
jgi:hypothetical protein